MPGWPSESCKPFRLLGRPATEQTHDKASAATFFPRPVLNKILKKKGLFEKGFTPNWTEEMFTVSKIQRTNPVTYEITDYNGEEIQGTFYEQELQKTSQEVFRIEKIVKKDCELRRWCFVN